MIQSFQTVADIPTNTAMAYKAYWPVFHFLPGNFDIPNLNPNFRSDLWEQRQYTSDMDSKSGAKASHLCEYFPWLTRPYSPMAIAMINNCKDLVNDDKSDISLHDLKDYLIGVTMHVFIDTWAHQDFVGYTSWEINGIQGDPTYWYSGQTKINGKKGAWGGSAKPVLKWSRNEASVWLGHGPAGHWPDHSSLIFEYTPNWRAFELTRDNPKEYQEAFVNMVYAIRCIERNEPYKPIKVEEAFIKMPPEGSWSRANWGVIQSLITTRRGTDGEPSGGTPQGWKMRWKAPLSLDILSGYTSYDTWDKNMYWYNSVWINALFDMNLESDAAKNEPLTHWAPGKSEWIEAAKAATEKKYLTPLEFNTLDYFKFNVAAKFHFRFVQQQLKAFGQQLLGDWPAGFAYANDLTTLRGTYSFSDKQKSDVINELRRLQKTTKKAEEQEALTVLIEQISVVTLVEARGIMLATIGGQGLLHSSGAVKASIEGIISRMPSQSSEPDESQTLVAKINTALAKYDTESKGFFKRSSEESKAAVDELRKLINKGNSQDLEDALSYIMGRETLRPGCLRDNLKCRPIKADGRLYKILSGDVS